MKICILITNRDPFHHIGSFLEDEINYLSEKFDRVHCFSIDASGKDPLLRALPENVAVYPLNGSQSKIRYPLYAFRGIISPSKDLIIKDKKSKKKVFAALYCRGRAKALSNRIFRAIKSSLSDNLDITVYSFWFSYQAVAAWLLGEKLKKCGYKVKSFSRAHGYDLYHYRNPMGFLPFQDASIKRMNRVFPCSDNGTNYLCEMYPDLKDKIKTARLGTHDYGLSGAAGKEYSKGEQAWVFLTCCNFKSLKRMPLFAKAFARLCDEINCRWICVGNGPELETVKDIIRQSNKEDRVRFTGEIDNKDLMEIYLKTRVSYFCNVSTTEGVPVSVMEALSFGVPVIATDVGGTGELIDNDVGALIPCDIDTDYLYEILKAQTNLKKSDYENKRKNARKRWELLSCADNNYSAWCDELA